MRLTSLLSSSVLFGHFLATEAVNPIFGAFITPACEACLDAAFESCPGDYRTREYAQCMCAGIGGEGGSMVNSCMAQHCDGSINEDTNVAIRRATYCVSILKEACSAEEQYLPASVYDRECSSSTIPTDTAMADATMAGTTTTGTARTAVTTPDSGLPSGNSLTATSAESKAATPSQSKSASVATAAAIPAWGMGIVAGLFAPAVHLLL